MTDQPTGFAEGGYDPADDAPTAGERAQSVIAQVCVEHPGRWDLSILVLDALLAHPDLLVDLAIEAGEPESWSTSEQCERRDGRSRRRTRTCATPVPSTDVPPTRRAMSDRAHTCHAEGCKVNCRPEYLMCGRHWRMVPRDVQRAVYAAYVPGQCDFDPLPSPEWHAAADAAIEAVAVKEGRRTPTEANDA